MFQQTFRKGMKCIDWQNGLKLIYQTQATKHWPVETVNKSVRSFQLINQPS